MPVEILDRGNLSPQQILVGMLNDPDLSDLTALVVLAKTENGTVLINHSVCQHSDKAFLAASLMDYAMRAARES